MKMSDFATRLAELPPGKLAILKKRQERALATIRRAQASPNSLTTITPRGNTFDTPPVSFVQEEWLKRVRLNPDESWGCIVGVRVKGPFSVSVLEQSLTEMVSRHESLRTTFMTSDSGSVQVISPPGLLRPTFVDLRELPEEQRSKEVERLALESVKQPFDLERGPLFKVTVCQLDKGDHAVLLIRHRMILDGWSNGILLRETLTLYGAFSAELPSPLPDVAIQFADYACWQRQWLKSAEGIEALAYWTEKIKDAHPVVNLPYDKEVPGMRTPSPTGGRFLILTKTLSESIMALNRREGVTLFMTTLATFFALLHRYTRQEDLCVATYAASRDRPEIEPLIGPFSDTLVLRARISSDGTFQSLLTQVKEVTLEAFAKQAVPFSTVAKALDPSWPLGSTHPLTQVRCRHEGSAMAGAGARLRHGVNNSVKGLNIVLPAGLTLSRVEFLDHLSSQPNDLSLNVQDSPDGISLAIDYATNRFEPSTIDLMLQQVKEFFETVVRDPQVRLSSLPL